MIYTPEPKEDGLRRYGAWAGNPAGSKENTAYCAEQIHSGWHFVQCSRKRGHGPDGIYCKQHAKKYDSR